MVSLAKGFSYLLFRIYRFVSREKLRGDVRPRPFRNIHRERFDLGRVYLENILARTTSVIAHLSGLYPDARYKSYRSVTTRNE